MVFCLDENNKPEVLKPPGMVWRTMKEDDVVEVVDEICFLEEGALSCGLASFVGVNKCFDGPLLSLNLDPGSDSNPTKNSRTNPNPEPQYVCMSLH